MAKQNIINKSRDRGHLESPFFMLPPEARNMIYHETFTGSEVALVIDPPRHVNIVPVTGRRSIFSTVNANHHFLLTCVQVYSEALALYWSTTVVRNGCDGHFSRGYFLNRIPATAKPYIQHLRDVNGAPSRGSQWLRGELIRWSSSLAESFDEFPKLKSCSIKDYWHTEAPGECDRAVARHPHVHILEKDVSIARRNALPVHVYIFDNHTLNRRLRWIQTA